MCPAEPVPPPASSPPPTHRTGPRRTAPRCRPGHAVALLVALAWGLGAGCARDAPLTEIAVGYGQGPEPNAVTLVNSILREAAAAGGPRIAVTLDPPPGPRSGPLELSDEVEHATRIAAKHSVAVVVGPGGSREALQVAPIYREAGVPQILPVATSALLPSRGPWTFRIAPGDSAQGEFIGDFLAHTLRGRAVTLFYIPDEYGRGLAAGTLAALARYGVRLIDRIPVEAAMSCRSEARRNPYEDVVRSSLRRGRPDVIVVAARQMETLCIARAAGREVPGVRIVAGDGAAITAEMRPLGGAAADSIYLVAFWTEGRNHPASRAFVERFQRLTGRLPTHGDAMWYDALMLAAEAIRAAGPDRNAIRQYLESLGAGRPPYQGVTGPIGFASAIRRPMIMTHLTGQGPMPARP